MKSYDLIKRWREDDRSAVIAISIYNIVLCTVLCIIFFVFDRDLVLYIADTIRIPREATADNLWYMGICMAVQSISSTILLLAAIRRGHQLPIFCFFLTGSLMIYYLCVIMCVTFAMITAGIQLLPTTLIIIGFAAIGIEGWFTVVVDSRCKEWEQRFLEKKRRCRDERLMPKFIEVICTTV